MAIFNTVIIEKDSNKALFHKSSIEIGSHTFSGRRLLTLKASLPGLSRFDELTYDGLPPISIHTNIIAVNTVYSDKLTLTNLPTKPPLDTSTITSAAEQLIIKPSCLVYIEPAIEEEAQRNHIDRVKENSYKSGVIV